MSNTLVAEDTRQETRTAAWVAAIACTALIFDGHGKTYSLTFLLVLNSGAVIGGMLASKLADRSGPQRIVATTFVLAAITLALMTIAFPLPVLFIVIAIGAPAAWAGSSARSSAGGSWPPTWEEPPRSTSSVPWPCSVRS